MQGVKVEKENILVPIYLLCSKVIKPYTVEHEVLRSEQ